MGAKRIKDKNPERVRKGKTGKGSERKGKGSSEKKGKGQEPFQEKPKKEEPKEDIRYIVRIVGKDLDGKLPIERALKAIKGIGIRAAKNIAIAFEKETSKSKSMRLGELGEEFDKKLEDIVANPGKHGLPVWTFNRRNDVETGENSHKVMADLEFALRNDLQRLNEIKSYRGLRLSWGLPVRGQSTKSTHRGKGKTVGVTKKDVKK